MFEKSTGDTFSGCLVWTPTSHNAFVKVLYDTILWTGT